MEFRILRQTIVVIILIALGFSVYPSRVIKSADPTPLTVWLYSANDKKALDSVLTLFHSLHPDIKVNVVQQDVASYGNALNIAFYQGQNTPDLFQIAPEDQIPFTTQVANRWLAPLNDFPDFPEFKATFPKTQMGFDEDFVVGQNVLNGAAYSAALQRPLPPIFLYANLNLYSKAGLIDPHGVPKAPTTMDEFTTHAQAIKAATGKPGVAFGGLSGIEAFWWLCQLSGPYMVDGKAGWDAKTGHYSFSSKVCFRNMIDNVLKMRDEGLILPESPTSTDSAIRELFAKGEIGHYIGDLSAIQTWKESTPGFSSSYTILPLPVLSGDKPTTFFYTSPGGRWMGINANSKVKDAAWTFYKFLYSKNYQDAWTKLGNGLGMFTSESTFQSSLLNTQKTAFSMNKLVVLGPDSTLRRPELSPVKITVLGQSPAEVLMALYTGKTTDIEAALRDLDERSETALDTAIANANASGITVTRADFIFDDWNPALPYIPKPANEPTPSDIIPNDLTPTSTP
jgi:multiple sugar transport system substrate-binding protein